MAVCKCTAILLQFVHDFKVHALLFSVRFEESAQHFTHATATWKSED